MPSETIQKRLIEKTAKIDVFTLIYILASYMHTLFK